MRTAIVITVSLLVLLGLTLGWFAPRDVELATASRTAQTEGTESSEDPTEAGLGGSEIPLPGPPAGGTATDIREADAETPTGDAAEQATAALTEGDAAEQAAATITAADAAEQAAATITAADAAEQAAATITAGDRIVEDGTEGKIPGVESGPAPDGLPEISAPRPPPDPVPEPTADELLEVSIASESGQVYVVRAGDSLGSIARERYGALAHYRRIYEENRDRIVDPDRIYPGQKLILPKQP